MAMLLEKLLILRLLFDDEPLNLILEEALITEETKSLLNEKFQNEQILKIDIKKALEELKKCNMIELLSESGEILDCNDGRIQSNS